MSEVSKRNLRWEISALRKNIMKKFEQNILSAGFKISKQILIEIRTKYTVSWI